MGVSLALGRCKIGASRAMSSPVCLHLLWAGGWTRGHPHLPFELSCSVILFRGSVDGHRKTRYHCIRELPFSWTRVVKIEINPQSRTLKAFSEAFPKSKVPHLAIFHYPVSPYLLQRLSTALPLPILSCSWNQADQVRLSRARVSALLPQNTHVFWPGLCNGGFSWTWLVLTP